MYTTKCSVALQHTPVGDMPDLETLTSFSLTSSRPSGPLRRDCRARLSHSHQFADHVGFRTQCHQAMFNHLWFRRAPARLRSGDPRRPCRRAPSLPPDYIAARGGRKTGASFEGNMLFGSTLPRLFDACRLLFAVRNLEESP